MNFISFLFLFLTSVISSCFFTAQAFGVKKAIPLPQTLSNSNYVVVVSIESITEKEDLIPPKPSGYITTRDGQKVGVFGGPDALNALTTFFPSANYNFKVVEQLKGKPLSKTTLRLPKLSSLSYEQRFSPSVGSKILLLLKGDLNNLEPTDPLRPFIPVSQGTKLITSGNEPKDRKIEDQVIDLLSQGASTPDIRKLSLYLMKDFVNPLVVVALAPYASESDLQLRDYALSGLARNHQLSAIPLIVSLNRELHQKNKGAQSVMQLENFTGDEEAVSYLNAGLFESEQYIRLNTIWALSQTANTSSYPYLLLTLFDPETQKINANSSRALLTKIITGEARNIESEPPFYFDWWQDELSGKHPVDHDEKPAVELQQVQHFETSDLPKLNQGLFMKSETTRRAAIRGLEQFADQSSIPYLLIALYDPQPKIAFDAYTLLHRLVPDLGAASADKWKTEQAMQTKMAFDWWQKYLSDAEKPMGK